MKSKKFIAALCALAVVVSSSGGLPFSGLRLFDTAVTASAEGTTVDLSSLADNYTAQDNNVLTGTTSHTVTIANGASITLNDAPVMLPGKPGGEPYYLMDLLGYSGIDFTHPERLEKPVELFVNGEAGQFSQKISEGDVVEIR